MENTSLLFIFSLTLIVIIIVWYLNSTSISKIILREISRHNETFIPVETILVTREEIAHFPKALKQYFEFCNLMGKEASFNFTLSFKGKFRLDSEKPWLKIKANQFSYIPNPTRLFAMKAYMFGIVTMVGEHVHHMGKGRFSGKLMRFIELFDEEGEHIDIGDLTTILNDIVLLSPSGLLYLKHQLSFKEIDNTTVEIGLQHEGIEIKAKLVFNEHGKLENFISDDRYFEEQTQSGTKEFVKHTWETPVIDYREFDGIKVVSRAKALWRLPEMTFEYADFSVNDISYNV